MIRFRSTRGGAATDLTGALSGGLAPDGGLYLPEHLPPFPPGFLESLAVDPHPTRTGAAVLRHLLEGEGGLPGETLERVARESLDFPIPLVPLGRSGPLPAAIHVLELFHGPTLAFKDVGARVMARLLTEVLPGNGSGNPLTILVATSGDTGGAVASAFLGVAGTRVVVLYPRGQVSPRQEAQFTTLGGNTRALAVEGTFDDCQRLVKEAFGDPALREGHRLASANSINVGRLLPQVIFHVHGRLLLPGPEAGSKGPETSPGSPVLVSVPSGNFGNLAAGLLAREMGLPVDRFVAACNANRVVPDYLRTGSYTPRPSLRTLSSAMDVGAPSNLERIRALFGDRVEAIRAAVTASSWTDEATRACIRRRWEEDGYLADPHTAVGILALEEALREAPRGARGIVLATAHPAKFAEVVEPAVGREIPLPAPLEERLGAPARVDRIAPRLPDLAAALAATPG